MGGTLGGKGGSAGGAKVRTRAYIFPANGALDSVSGIGDVERAAAWAPWATGRVAAARRRVWPRRHPRRRPPQRALQPGTRGPGRQPPVTGSLDRSIIQRVFRQHANQMRYCYEKELVKIPTLAGKVTLKVTIGADGKVKAAVVNETSLKNAAVEGCMVEKAKTWLFPAPRGGVVLVSYPYVFRPR
ncbi:MAG: AgmX/PglI C-terminal domain-containing protein [bacterium]